MPPSESLFNIDKAIKFVECQLTLNFQELRSTDKTENSIHFHLSNIQRAAAVYEILTGSHPLGERDETERGADFEEINSPNLRRESV